MKKRILVTGAGGYIGRHVVRTALDIGCDVIASDFVKKGVDERAKFIDTPIFSGIENIYQKLGSPDVLIHLAWKDGFVHKSKAHMEELSSHVKFLNSMIDSGLPILSVMGSMHEVGYWEGAIDENTPCNPLNQYGVAKNALRQSTMLYNKEKNTCLHWLRAFYIYGDDSHGSSIFSKILQSAENGQRAFPFTSGKNKYDFISVEELGKLIVAASIQDKIYGITNVCSGTPKSLAEQVEWYIQEKKLNVKLEYGKYPDRQYDSPCLWGDTEKIKAILEASNMF